MELFCISAYLYCCSVHRKHSSVIIVDDEIRKKPSITFSGCGLRYHFYCGIQEYCLDNFDTNDVSVLCSSGGIFAAVPLVLGLKTRDWMKQDWDRCYAYWMGRKMAVWLDTTDFIRDLWRRYLPDDAYCRCSGRLFIAVSRFTIYGFRGEIVSEYKSNEELIDAIIGTIHILGVFRHLPICRNKYVFDGCFTNLQPQINDRYSATCAAFKPTIVCKLFGRGTIDYSNKLSITKIMSIVEPEDCDAKIAEGYQIAEKHRSDFLKAGFVQKNI